MGYYINPSDCGEFKRDYFKAKFNSITLHEFLEIEPSPHGYPVVVVENGYFDAAAVGFSRDEVKYFVNPDDGRGKTFFCLSLDEIETLDPNCASQLRRYSETNEALNDDS